MVVVHTSDDTVSITQLQDIVVHIYRTVDAAATRRAAATVADTHHPLQLLGFSLLLTLEYYQWLLHILPRYLLQMPGDCTIAAPVSTSRYVRIGQRA